MNPPVPTQSAEAIELRPEARPLRFEELDDQQAKAFRTIVDLLHRAAEAVRPADSEGAAPSVGWPARDYLPTRSILVDGGRGTGKTSLLLTLERALDAGSGPGLRPPGSHLGRLPEPTADRIDYLRQRLVWLKTLDLEPLSDDANLLGAVLARVQDAVDEPSLDEACTATSLLYPCPEHRQAFSDLTRLQTSVARVFDGNLTQRAGGLDPDTFAFESRLGERERLGLGRSFREVMAKLSGILQQWRGLHLPVFVLPVDDLDLNLRQSISLLRLLRAVQSPHLVVLLAADLALLQAILRLKYHGELAQVASPAVLGADEQHLADDLAANVLRKHLPPTQRVQLGLADPAWALDLRPLPGAPRLRDLLDGVELPPDEASLVLDTHFWDSRDDPQPKGGAPVASVTSLGSPLPPHGERRIRDTIKGYSWPDALRIPARRVVDLHLNCWADRADHQAGNGGPADTALRAFARERLREWAGGLPPGRDETEFVVRPRLVGPQAPSGDRPQVIGQTWRGWTVLRYNVPLPSDESTAFVGCFELADDRDRPWRINPSLPPLRASRLPTKPGAGPVVIAWPWVGHSTFWGYERAAKWLDHAEEQWRNQPYPAFGAWIAVMTAQMFDVREDVQQPFDVPARELAGSWEQLGHRLDDLQDHDGDSRRGLARQWLIAVGLLCTPEMGMDDPGQQPQPFLPTDVQQDHLPEPLARRRASLRTAGVAETAFSFRDQRRDR